MRSKLIANRFCLLLCAAALLMARPSVRAQDEDVVGPEDILAVSIFGQPTLSGKYIVESDGTFAFPLIGRIQAGGLPVRAIEESITARLRDGYLKQPQVTISIEEHRSRRIFIMGEIRQPGEYTLRTETTLLEAIARAGSTSAEASGDIVVLRSAEGGTPQKPLQPDDEGTRELVRVSLSELQNGRFSQNIVLRDGDTIFLPRGEKVFVYGQVRAPGAYPVQRGMTVIQALSLAGGVTERGASNRVRVERMVDGERKQRDVKLDDAIQSGDTLIVPERYF
jgi:polysaccharide export outer membrane protein